MNCKHRKIHTEKEESPMTKEQAEMMKPYFEQGVDFKFFPNYQITTYCADCGLKIKEVKLSGL